MIEKLKKGIGILTLRVKRILHDVLRLDTEVCFFSV